MSCRWVDSGSRERSRAWAITSRPTAFLLSLYVRNQHMYFLLLKVIQVSIYITAASTTSILTIASICSTCFLYTSNTIFFIFVITASTSPTHPTCTISTNIIFIIYIIIFILVFPNKKLEHIFLALKSNIQLEVPFHCIHPLYYLIFWIWICPITLI